MPREKLARTNMRENNMFQSGLMCLLTAKERMPNSANSYMSSGPCYHHRQLLILELDEKLQKALLAGDADKYNHFADLMASKLEEL